MKIAFGSKWGLNKTPYSSSRFNYELGLCCTRMYIVNLKKLCLPPKEWAKHLIPVIRIGISLIVAKCWMDITLD